jgi:hypothetical protein
VVPVRVRDQQMAADRALGLLAATAGELDAAERHFEDAIVLEERMRAFALAARTRYSYGRVLLAKGGRRHRRRAEAVLDDALNAAEALELPGLARAIREQAPEVVPHSA